LQASIGPFQVFSAEPVTPLRQELTPVEHLIVPIEWAELKTFARKKRSSFLLEPGEQRKIVDNVISMANVMKRFYSRNLRIFVIS
jgi:hypothetical protein